MKLYQREDSIDQREDSTVVPQETHREDNRTVTDYQRTLDDLVAALRENVGALKLNTDDVIGTDEFCVSEDNIYLKKVWSPGHPDADSDYFCSAKWKKSTD